MTDIPREEVRRKKYASVSSRHKSTAINKHSVACVANSPAFHHENEIPPTPKVNEDRVNNEPTNGGIFSQQRSPTDSKPLLPPVSLTMNDDCNGNTCCEEG
jgi:hypothetical protein